MPRTKFIPATPEQLDRDCWKRVNREVQKAMSDKGITSVSGLADCTGISAQTLHNHFELRSQWKLMELWRCVYSLDMEQDALNRIFKRKEVPR